MNEASQEGGSVYLYGILKVNFKESDFLNSILSDTNNSMGGGLSC